MTYTQNGFIFDDDGRVLTVSMAGGEALPTGAYQQNGFTFDEDGKLIVLSDSAQSGSVSAQVTDGAGGYEDGQIVLYVGPDEPPAPPDGSAGVWIEQAS